MPRPVEGAAVSSASSHCRLSAALCLARILAGSPTVQPGQPLPTVLRRMVLLQQMRPSSQLHRIAPGSDPWTISLEVPAFSLGGFCPRPGWRFCTTNETASSVPSTHSTNLAVQCNRSTDTEDLYLLLSSYCVEICPLTQPVLRRHLQDKLHNLANSK